MSRKLLYIINPISGTKNKRSARQIIEKETKKAGFVYAIYPSVANGDYSFLHSIIKEEKFTDIIIAGGDGTINQVVNSLRKFDVQFGIIPSGSGNGLALSAGISKNISVALKTIFAGESKPTDAFLINSEFACMLCGLGLDGKVAHDFATAPKRGLITYVRKTLKNFISAKTYSFILKTEKKEIKANAFFISIANSNQFGNNFTIAPKASLTDGFLDVVIMTKQNKLSMLFQAVRQISGYNKLQAIEMVNEKASIIYFQTKEIKISNQASAPMHIDGDPVETMKHLDIKLLPDCFRLIS